MNASTESIVAVEPYFGTSHHNKTAVMFCRKS